MNLSSLIDFISLSILHYCYRWMSPQSLTHFGQNNFFWFGKRPCFTTWYIGMFVPSPPKHSSLSRHYKSKLSSAHNILYFFIFLQLKLKFFILLPAQLVEVVPPKRIYFLLLRQQNHMSPSTHYLLHFLKNKNRHLTTCHLFVVPTVLLITTQSPHLSLLSCHQHKSFTNTQLNYLWITWFGPRIHVAAAGVTTLTNLVTLPLLAGAWWL